MKIHFFIILVAAIFQLSGCLTVSTTNGSLSKNLGENPTPKSVAGDKPQTGNSRTLLQAKRAKSRTVKLKEVNKKISFNPKKPLKWYQNSASQGGALAQVYLGYMYLRGKKVTKNVAAARQWFSRAALQGHYEGQRMLGYIHLTGTGVDIDGTEAEQWYLLAANQGHIDSQASLQHMYTQGFGVAKDPQKAKMWQKRVEGARLFGKVWTKKVYWD